MPASKHTFKSIAVTQAIAIFAFVVVPAAVTFVAPRTTINVRRINGQPSAEIAKHILLVVPCRKVTIAPVERVESHVTSGQYKYSSHSDRQRGRKTYSAGDGSIWIFGRDSKSQVQSNPTDAPVQTAQIQTFLENPNAEPFLMTATAGWALTYLLGGIMTGLCALYCVGAVLAVCYWLLRLALPRDLKLIGKPSGP